MTIPVDSAAPYRAISQSMTAPAPYDRCNGCGGIVEPNLVGRHICTSCGAPSDFGKSEPAVETLVERLLFYRRTSAKGKHEWLPSDDDVKVTVHA